jgi:hypothetical protein
VSLQPSKKPLKALCTSTTPSPKTTRRRSVSHCDLAIFTFKFGILRQKKNYENSNIISPCQNIIFIKNKKLEETDDDGNC